MLPKDPNILVSVMNTKLRDHSASPEDVCDALGEDIQEINGLLEQAGFYYEKEVNQFRAIKE